ncbi:hypothetical protein KAR91_84570 [Candidatus Pacearchaeota archaeon]|nr:hypothetical protein [Candidatus Pacearchaeota archaeon]
MAGRPLDPKWIAIEKAYKAGKTVNDIVREFGVTKKTLQNRISLNKWELSGIASDTISKAVDISGNFRELSGSDPESAKHLADKVEELTNFNVLLEDVVMLGLKVQKEIFETKKVSTQANAMGEVIDLERSLTPLDVKNGMDAVYKAKEIKFGKEFPAKEGDSGSNEPIDLTGYELENPHV